MFLLTWLKTVNGLVMVRPCDGDGLLKSPIYGVYMRNVNNVTMENVHSKAQEGFPYGGEIAEK